MTDPFDRLEADLRRSMRSWAPSPRRPWRRPSGLAAFAAVMLVSGGALAATRMDSGRSVDQQGRRIAFEALQQTRSDPACRQTATARRIVEGAPLPTLLAVLPVLGTPPDPPSVLDEQPHGRVLRSSIHRRDVGGGVRITVYVEEGGAGPWGLADRAKCRNARRARADVLLENRRPAIRRAALRHLGEQRDTAPGLQMLWLTTHLAGTRGSGGAGAPVRPGEPLRPGLFGSSTALSGRSSYTGIAVPGAVRISARRRHGTRHFTTRVVDGLFCLRLPAHTGPITVRELDVTGRQVATFGVRE